MAQLFNMTTDQIINYDGKIPQEVVIEDKTATEQMGSFNSSMMKISKRFSG
jgi:hypothetical protein